MELIKVTSANLFSPLVSRDSPSDVIYAFISRQTAAAAQPLLTNTATPVSVIKHRASSIVVRNKNTTRGGVERRSTVYEYSSSHIFWTRTAAVQLLYVTMLFWRMYHTRHGERRGVQYPVPYFAAYFIRTVIFGRIDNGFKVCFNLLLLCEVGGGTTLVTHSSSHTAA